MEFHVTREVGTLYNSHFDYLVSTNRKVNNLYLQKGHHMCGLSSIRFQMCGL